MKGALHPKTKGSRGSFRNLENAVPEIWFFLNQNIQAERKTGMGHLNSTGLGNNDIWMTAPPPAHTAERSLPAGAILKAEAKPAGQRPAWVLG